MSEWACVTCKWPPVEGQMRDTLYPDFKAGPCSNLSCPTRKPIKTKLRNNVRGAEYAENPGQSLFRRTSGLPKGHTTR